MSTKLFSALVIAQVLGLTATAYASPRVQLVAQDEAHAVELTRSVRQVPGCESARWEYRSSAYVVTCDR